MTKKRAFRPPFYQKLPYAQHIHVNQVEDRVKSLEGLLDPENRELSLKTTSDLPAGIGLMPNLVMWLDSAFESTLTSGVDEDHVSHWRDLSGFDNHFEQGIAACQPKRVLRGGIPVLEFDGVDDFMSCTSATGFSYRAQGTCYFVVNWMGSTAASYVIMNGKQGSNPRWPRLQQYRQSSSLYRWLAGGADRQGRSSWVTGKHDVVQNDVWGVVAVRFRGTSSADTKHQIFVNGTKQQRERRTRTPYSTTLEVSELVMGESSLDGYNWHGQIAEVAAFDVAHSDSQVRDLTTDLRTKWGI